MQSIANLVSFNHTGNKKGKKNLTHPVFIVESAYD
jgi:hypothetical protein